MSRYVRPPIDTMAFLELDGQFSGTGYRSPASASPTKFAHPGAALQVVADALVAHLRAAYDVEVTTGLTVADDLLFHPDSEIERAVRIRPRNEKCAPLTLVYTAGGVCLHAGVLHDFPFPARDAAGADWMREADELEREVLAVAAGRYWEGIDKAAHPWIGYAFSFRDGKESGRSRADDWPSDRVDAAKRILFRLPIGWAAWPKVRARIPASVLG
ncbi:DUF6226 family protein [Gulosibacter sp. ACHW.36C]|uniref:DUF6226 family protein n=1 Tax=Gulosibacter sediminis TaxID=1729695 RepID=A0ABY4MXG2_9MICO|nr:DUF6226 family protein [Gulosibacter sediminis]UQN15123.1 DUF6226 family protein [Gulosibacter sediminis]